LEGDFAEGREPEGETAKRAPQIYLGGLMAAPEAEALLNTLAAPKRKSPGRKVHRGFSCR
jgi:hypothetical protein